MAFNFDWNYVAAGAPYITVSETALGFNSPASTLLGNPDKVIVGFDRDNLAIGVKQSDSRENAKEYPFYSRMNNGWVRIGCKDFIKNLSVLTGQSFSPAKRFLAQFDSESNVLYISLRQETQEDQN